MEDVGWFLLFSAIVIVVIVVFFACLFGLFYGSLWALAQFGVI